MNQLVGDAARKLRNDLLRVIAASQSAQGTLQLQLANRFSQVTILAHAVDRGEAAQLFQVLADAFFYQLVGLARLRLTAAQVLLNDVPQVIHCVEIHVRQIGHLRFNVPRHGDVHHQYRPMLAHLDRLFHRALAQNRQLAGRGGNHDIRVRQVFGNFRQQHRLGTELLRQFTRPAQRSVGNHNAPHARLDQVPGHQFNRFTGTDQQRIAGRQVGKNMSGEVDRRVGNRDRVFADGGVCTHPLGQGKDLLEQAAHVRTDRARFGSDSVGRLELAEYLRLSQHHGVQPAGHFHHVPQRIRGFVVIGSAAQFIAGQVVVVGNPVHQLRRLLGAPRGLRHHGVKLGAIAGGQDHDLVQPRVLTGVLKRFRHLLRRKRHPLAHFDAGRVVVDSEGNEVHIPRARLRGWRVGKTPRTRPHPVLRGINSTKLYAE